MVKWSQVINLKWSVFFVLVLLPTWASAQALSPSVSHATAEERRGMLGLSAQVGHRLSGEDETPQAQINWVGSSLAYMPLPAMSLDANFAYSSHDQTYVSQNSTVAQDAAISLEESRWDLGLNMGYDVLPEDVLDGRLALAPSVGLRMFWLDNEAFGTSGGGPQGGLTTAFEATEELSLQAGFKYAHVLFGDEQTLSVLGAPEGLWSYDAGAIIDFGDHWGLRLSYVGETLVFERTYRVSNGAALAIDLRLL